MAIDTPNKRRSCAGHKIASLVIRSLPDSTIGTLDRLQAGAYYSGFDVQYIPRTHWVPSYDVTVNTWTTTTFISSQWKNSSKPSSTWINQREANDD
jgi:arylamine N-acetyltransferase